VKSLDFDDHPFEIEHGQGLRTVRRHGQLPRRGDRDDAGPVFVCSDSDHCAERRAAVTSAHARCLARRHDRRSSRPAAARHGLTKLYGRHVGCRDVSVALWRRGPVRGRRIRIRQNTLLNCLSGHLPPTAGKVEYDTRIDGLVDLATLSEAARRLLRRTDWGVVHQNPRDGLRMAVSAGANVGERLMAVGERHYGRIRGERWIGWVGGDRRGPHRRPAGDLLRRHAAAAADRRNLVTRPRLVFMDEPTGGLDVSVQRACST